MPKREVRVRNRVAVRKKRRRRRRRRRNSLD